MDKQQRILLPQKLRDLVDFDISKPHALCVEDDKIFFLVEKNQYENQLAVDCITPDKKGRVFISSTVLEHYGIPEDAEEFIFVQNKRIYISFVDE